LENLQENKQLVRLGWLSPHEREPEYGAEQVCGLFMSLMDEALSFAVDIPVALL